MYKKKNRKKFDSQFWVVAACVASAALLLCLYIAVCAKTNFDPVNMGVLILIAYAVCVAVVLISAKVLSMKKKIGESLNPVLGNIMLDTVSKLPSPVLICDEPDGRIIWYNKALASLAPQKGALHGEMISSIFSTSVVKIMRNEGTDGAAVNSLPDDDGDVRNFRAVGYRLKNNDKNYCVIVFTECTELERMYTKMAEEETIAAYIIVDNLDELLQYEQEKYRAASSEIEVILRNWAEGCGGILKEYERDKYIFLFASRYLDDFIIQRFDIFDRVRDIRVGEGNLPVTISIGVARVSGSLFEKERAAHGSLDMALQRGGDQAALKTASGAFEFFGGRTKPVQKRIKVKARVITSELINHISKSGNVLIMGHRNPDFDAIGACAGIFRLTQFCGVKANIVTNVNESAIYPAIKRITKLSEYRDALVDGVTALEMVRSDTLLIIVDVNSRDVFESPEIYDNVQNIVIIDHHRKREEFRVSPLISYIEPSASASCELVAEMLEQALPPGMLHKEEANLLLAGILLDTKQFTKTTGTRTFSSALFLRDAGADPVEVQEMFRTNLEDFMREAKFNSNVIMYRGRMAIAVYYGDGENADRIAAAKAADKLLSINGVIASFALVKIADSVHISARSTGAVNVQLILEKLKGGGHFDSAGAQIVGASIDSALSQLQSAIDEVYAPSQQ